MKIVWGLSAKRIMKILLVNKFHYVKGGSETYYFGLGDLLRRHGHEVIYFSMQDPKNQPCDQSQYFVKNIDFNAHMGIFKLIKTARNMLYSREAKRKFKKLLLAERPDVIHLNIFQSQLTGSIVDAAYRMHIPIVYTAHDLKSICPNYQMLNHGEVCEKCLHGDYSNCFKTSCMKDSKLKSLLATMEANTYKRRKIYQKLDLVITPSAFYKKKIEEAGIMRCPVIHMANFLPEDTVYEASNVSGDYLLYFGRLSCEKGIVTLVEAYAQVKTELPLYIVGSGPIQEEIEKKIKELGVGDRVSLLGYKSGQELKEIVKNSRCVCLPSEWYENGPYSIMEAMAAGKPVIVSNMGGLPEMVENGINGYVFMKKDELADRLEQIADLPDDEYKNMCERSFQRARILFNAKNYIVELKGLYKQLVE